MERKYTKEVGRFVAKDANGKQYVLVAMQTIIVAETLDGGREEIPGLRSIKTIDGKSVNRIEQGKYRIIDFVETDLTSDDPKAL